MAHDLVTISLRIPRRVNEGLEAEVKRGAYASKTEIVREALREHALAAARESLQAMRGALKGKVDPKVAMDPEWNRKEWKKALEKAGGDSRKASRILDEAEKKALAGLRL